MFILFNFILVIFILKIFIVELDVWGSIFFIKVEEWVGGCVWVGGVVDLKGK